MYRQMNVIIPIINYKIGISQLYYFYKLNLSELTMVDILLISIIKQIRNPVLCKHLNAVLLNEIVIEDIQNDKQTVNGVGVNGVSIVLHFFANDRVITSTNSKLIDN